MLLVSGKRRKLKLKKNASQPMRQHGQVATDTGLKPQYIVKYRHLSGGNQLNQHCASSFGDGSRVTDVCLNEKKKKSSTPGLEIPAVKL